jgi:hypothetical protein
VSDFIAPFSGSSLRTRIWRFTDVKVMGTGRINAHGV